MIAKDAKMKRAYDVSRLTMVLCIRTGLFDNSRYFLLKEGRATFFYKRTYYAIALFIKLVFLSRLLSGSNTKHVFAYSMLRSSYETRDVTSFFSFKRLIVASNNYAVRENGQREIGFDASFCLRLLADAKLP